MTTDKGKCKPVNAVRVLMQRGSRTLSRGLWCDPSKWQLDQRTNLARELHTIRAGLADMFPDGPNQAATLLIDRVCFKSIKLALYELMDLTGEGADGQGGVGTKDYLAMANSLRTDLNVLHNLAGATCASPPDDPSLTEYLNTIRKAARAEVIRTPAPPPLPLPKPKGNE